MLRNGHLKTTTGRRALAIEHRRAIFDHDQQAAASTITGAARTAESEGDDIEDTLDQRAAPTLTEALTVKSAVARRNRCGPAPRSKSWTDQSVPDAGHLGIKNTQRNRHHASCRATMIIDADCWAVVSKPPSTWMIASDRLALSPGPGEETDNLQPPIRRNGRVHFHYTASDPVPITADRLNQYSRSPPDSESTRCRKAQQHNRLSLIASWQHPPPAKPEDTEATEC